MKLGTETGSLVNHLYSRGTIGQPVAVVGMGATELMWTDRDACTIVEVVMDKGEVKRIATTSDDSKVVSGSGHDGSAAYDHTSKPDGYRTYWRMSKAGKWESIVPNDVGRWVKSGNGKGLRIGSREKYSDPSF